MYLGRQQLGTWLDVYLQCLNSNKTPLMPDAVPTIKIRRADNAVVYSDKMPLVDKAVNVGLFCSRLLLGQGFSVGMHTVEMVYAIGGAAFIVDRTFEIMTAGDSRGQSLAAYYLHTPSADHVIYQCESGVILRGKNPRVN